MQFQSIYPQSFPADWHFKDAAAAKLAEFFHAKGLARLKQEDRNEVWYEDWLAHQAEHRLYASLLSPKEFSSLGNHFDVLRYAKFLEVFGYFSPAHGYSLQVTFLGLFAILMGTNSALKKEAIATLEAGGLFAFGISEKHHGSDLLANEFAIKEIANDKFVANGSKYYIGNANCASIISTLARKENVRTKSHRAPVALIALRPKQITKFHTKKIHTLGVRGAFVGEFEVINHDLPQSDLIAEGRAAWDSIFGTITLGKFFLSFGSIGICEHALQEAIDHLSKRILFGKPVIHMPHIRLAMSQAYARLTAMKLYAYRALDYVHAASADDRRYLLYCAVQKAKVSTEGVKVMSQLSECIGAKGFESDAYFEMALRDVQLFPGLEGSTHINLAMAAQFIPQYFANSNSSPPDPKSLFAAGESVDENSYLFEARTSAVSDVNFSPFLKAYEPLISIPNVQLFVKQIEAFRDFDHGAPAEIQHNMPLAKCMATIAYAQLIAENSLLLRIPREMISAIFQLLVTDLSVAAIALKAEEMIALPQTTQADWEAISSRLVVA